MRPLSERGRLGYAEQKEAVPEVWILRMYALLSCEDLSPMQSSGNDGGDDEKVSRNKKS
jgi:hypothetical protein